MPSQERIEREGSSSTLLKEMKHLLSELRSDYADEDNSRLNLVVTRVLFIIRTLLEREKEEFREGYDKASRYV